MAISAEDETGTFISIRSHPTLGLGGAWALEQNLSFAAGIGIFLALYTSNEFTTSSVLARLLGISQTDSNAILYKINGYAPRLTRIEKIAEERLPADIEFYRKFISEMRWFNDERNKYAHAHFLIGDTTGKVYRGLWATEERKDTIWEEFPMSRLEKDVMRARKFTAWVWQEMQGKIPPGYL